MDKVPVQAAQIIQQPTQEPLRIIQIAIAPGGQVFGLDQDGKTYIAAHGKVDPSRMYWELVIGGIE